MRTKSLKASGSELSATERQISILNDDVTKAHHSSFAEMLEPIGLLPLMPQSISVFQVNLGKMCNQVCEHCHVDAGPDRKEIMTQETMQLCIDVLAAHPEFTTVDMTGGAPEMNPNFRWFVEEVFKLGRHMIVRCNLTIIRANKKYYDLPDFYKKHGVEVVSSLPFYSEDRTDKQRGNGVFADSIDALQMLNAVGYGQPNSGLELNLVYNPAGAFLPPAQDALEKEFKTELFNKYGIVFNSLFAITNLPISRYLQYLLISGNYERYMEKLIQAFNPQAANNVMCRTTLSIGWDGYLYDCDFNQMLELKVNCKESQHLSTFKMDQLQARTIQINQHCFGCTAGAGSSCGGQVA